MTDKTESWDTVMVNNMFFPYSKLGDNMLGKDSTSEEFVEARGKIEILKSLSEKVDILIPKMESQKTVDSLELIYAIKDIIDTGNDFKFRQL